MCTLLVNKASCTVVVAFSCKLWDLVTNAWDNFTLRPMLFKHTSTEVTVHPFSTLYHHLSPL